MALKTDLNHIDFALLAAMPEEQDFFVQQFKDLPVSTLQAGGLDFKIYTYKNHKIVMTATGIGTAFAASLLTLVQACFKPRYVFITGTAGSMKPDVKLNDVVIVEKAFEAELQNLSELIEHTPFKNCLINPLNHQRIPTLFSADAELVKLCQSLSFSDFQLHKSTAVSSNAFPAPKALFEKIKSLHPACIDMETSAFYQIAWLLHINILAIRGISNMLNEDGTDDKLHESDLNSANRAAQVALAVIDQLLTT